MSMKTLAAFALVAVLVAAGIAYLGLRENSPGGATSGLAGGRPASPQATAPTPSSTAQSDLPSTAPQSQATAPSANAEPSVPSPGTTSAPRTTLPAEDQMSEEDRRQTQQMLQALNFYQGPIDGKFGPATRAAIRHYQVSIGAKSTGHLTGEEATRLATRG